MEHLQDLKIRRIIDHISLIVTCHYALSDKSGVAEVLQTMGQYIYITTHVGAISNSVRDTNNIIHVRNA